MITNFKIFETINEGDPKIGDYVLLKYDKFKNDMTNFLNDHIGKIIFIDEKLYRIEYYDVPDTINYRFHYYKTNNSYTKTIEKRYISYWSKNREELEELLAAEKYNL